ncbi:MAG: LysE family transporter [Kiloniellales bacterium]|nr:LysE family transporter [Kiloniellales bacterium]
MEYLIPLAGLALAHFIAAASPGPAFIVALQESVARDRRAGVAAAVGIALGSFLWALLVVLGVGLLLQQAGWLYGTLRLLGGLYLIYLGICLWRGAVQPLALPATAIGLPASGLRSLRLGLLTQLVNPKAAVFFGSIFLTFLPPDLPLWVTGVVLANIFAVEFFWYLAVALLFSTGRVRRAYAGAKLWIDRLAGGCLAALGLKLALSER